MTSKHHYGRGGFSLVELLVVIGILVLLAAIVTVGLSGVLGRQQDRDTENRLQILESMLDGYANTGDAGSRSGRGLPPRIVPSGGTAYNGGAGVWYSVSDASYGNAGSDTPTPASGADVDAPIDLTNEQDASGTAFTLNQSEIQSVGRSIAGARTQAVLRRLLDVKQNSDIFLDLPASARAASTVFGEIEQPRIYFSAGASTTFMDPPLLLDGSSGVILYVPPTGVRGLTFEGDTSWNPATDILVSEDGTAFFMSAGSDGLFTAADDNLYSTTVRAFRP